MFHNLPLIHACYHNKLKSMQHLIQEYNAPYVISNGYDQGTMLHYAADSNSIEMIDYIMSLDGIKGNGQQFLQSVNIRGDTPLFYACYLSRLNATRHFIEKYNVQYLTPNTKLNSTIVHYAAGTNNIETIDYIMSLEGIKGNEQQFFETINDEGYAPIFYVCKFKFFNSMKHLIEQYNAPYLIPNPKNQLTILHYATNFSDKDFKMIHYVMSLDGIRDNEQQFLEAVDIKGRTPLLLACYERQVNTMKHLIEQYNAQHLTSNHINQFTLLHYTIDRNHDDIEMLDYVMSLLIDESLKD